MKFPRFSYIRKMLERKKTAPERQARLLLTALNFTSYAKLSVQEKIILVARLMDRFQTDYGFVPSKLEKTLLTLNRGLNKELKKSFETSRNIQN